MSRRGDCWDNALAESFFATLQVELVHNAAWRIRAAARAALFECIEIDGARPAEFRRPPDLGQHNREILLDLLGLDPVEYQRLIDAQIIY